jgi:ubiquinone/menaquinone biosynthesis C-methylase UbiE
MSQSFQDHFSDVAAGYSRFRPCYPTALFDYLASLIPPSELAWDCATGSGQAAIALAELFRRVIATDASARQLEFAQAHPRVEYRVAPAEASGLRAASVDLITVAQAVHWFDQPAFYAEARRVLRPDALIALWAYGHVELACTAAQRVIDVFYHETVGPYWPSERELIESGYRTLDFPFAELVPPPFVMEAAFTLQDLLGYVHTWSATRRFTEAQGYNPLSELERNMNPVWGPLRKPQTVRWPLAMRIGRHEDVINPGARAVSRFG